MDNAGRRFIGGTWVEPGGDGTIEVVNPATEEAVGRVPAGTPDDDDAVRIANDSVYGLAGWLSAGDLHRARRVAARLRAGQIYVNNAQIDFTVPFGGYKMPGNGREFGEWGLEEFLEVKAVLGYSAS